MPSSITGKNVFITGGSGYIGRTLIPRLLEKGHNCRALVRPGSQKNLPVGCEAAVRNALDSTTFADQIRPSDTFVQLVGVPHPSPSKAREFKSIDLVSARASVSSAAGAGVTHFIYVSVAQPAPVMKAYQSVRAEVENLIRDSGLNSTILRPWYVLGPGHRWPYALIPMYWLLELIPSTRDTARRLGLVTLNQIVNAIVAAVEANPAASMSSMLSRLRKVSTSALPSLTRQAQVAACSEFLKPRGRVRS